MQIRVTNKILDYEGKPIKSVPNSEKDATWREIISNALNASIEGEVMSGDDKGRAYLLTMRAYQSESPDFTVEERSFILERIKKVYSPLAVGRAMEFFEEKEEAKPMAEA